MNLHSCRGDREPDGHRADLALSLLFHVALLDAPTGRQPAQGAARCAVLMRVRPWRALPSPNAKRAIHCVRSHSRIASRRSRVPCRSYDRGALQPNLVCQAAGIW